MERERGFTLIEMVTAVAITVILLGAGGVWMLSMHPGSLRNAADDFDADLAAARAIAASSGNGATIAIVPRATGGFVLRVYSGRPTAANAVQPANVAQLTSAASVREATFGTPPFALFFDSAGEPTGAASYPNVDAQGNVTFAMIAQQPPCPPGGITLTFGDAQGATVTRTLACTSAVAGVGTANPSPTPNPPHIVPNTMVAHWTGDTFGALTFYVAEFGYTHWYADPRDNACDAMTTFATPNPYSPPQSAREAAAPPAPPPTPYSWANTMYGGNANDPQSHFALNPVPGTPGVCTLAIADDYGQEATAQVQVMGDLHATTPATLTWQLPDTSPRTVTFAKVWDSEPIALQESGPCASLVTVAQSGGSTPPSPDPATAATATLSITPTGARGSCTLLVTDQYHETPFVPVTITVSSQFQTWPEQIQLGAGGVAVSYAPRSAFDFVAWLNHLAGGGVAQASTPGCYAYALTYPGGAADPAPAQANAVGVYTDANGCFLTSNGGPPATHGAVVAYEPGGNTASYNIAPQTTCNGTTASTGGWNPSSAQGVQVGLQVLAGGAAGTCNVALTDRVTATPTMDHGLAVIHSQSGYTMQVLLVSENCSAGGWNNCTGLPTQYVWNAFAVPSGQQISGKLTCTQSGIIMPGPPPKRGCLTWAYIVTPAMAQTVCGFQTTGNTNAGGTLYGFGANATDAYFWSMIISGTNQNLSNSLGWSCATLQPGGGYYIGSY
jgi:prepilin-type N-terminal cleavage/methylation domain-containing protein